MKSYSTNRNIRQLAALLTQFGIEHVVACPGSRNAPIVHTLANVDGLTLHPVTDERSAGFVAIGLADSLGKAVAVCCTSGSALLNLAPAVAEARYRSVPLLVISGDRPQKWIGQMDGQTIVQSNALAPNAPTFSLPEDGEANDWFCNRLLNEALHLLSASRRPVHINIPLDEPLFGFSDEPLQAVRKVERTTKDDLQSIEKAKKEWRAAVRPMILVGQMSYDAQINEQLNSLAESGRAVVLAEHLSNVRGKQIVYNFDDILAAEPSNGALQPDMIIYMGGHIVSKRLKHFLRRVKPQTDWHVTTESDFVDLFQCLTRRVEMSPRDLLNLIVSEPTSAVSDFVDLWHALSVKYCTKITSEWNEQNAVSEIISSLPADSQLVLANSSSVRWAQHFQLPDDVLVFCNRGVNGIEGSMSAAVGTAMAQPAKKTVLIIGDLSFFYDMNALWNRYLPRNLTIVLINNSGGEIFNHLPGLENSEHVGEYIAAHHMTHAQGWAADANCNYTCVNCFDQASEALNQAFNRSDRASIVEMTF